MRSLTLRRTLALTATSVLLAALTACGGDDTGTATDEPTTASSSAAAEPSESAATEEEADDTEPAAGEEVDADQFLADFKAAVEDATTAHLSMTTGAGGMDITAEGQVDYSTEPPSMAMEMTNPMGGDQKMEIRLVDGKFYMNMGQLSQGKYYELSLDDPNNPLGDMSGLTESMDPVRSFEQFASGLEKVTFVGTEDVDGEQLDHYVLTLDTTKVDSLKDAGAQLPETLDYDLWLDDQDRMRQVQIDLGSTASVDMKIFDWDEPVDIEAPSEDEIAPMPGR